MNKQEFLAEIRDQLSEWPQKDIDKSLDYYAEMIEDRMEEGLSEEEAVAALGSTDEIVAQIRMDTPLSKLVKGKIKPQRSFKIWEIVLLIIGAPLWLPLLMAAAIIVFALYIVLWSIIVVFYAVDVSFAAAAVSGIFGSFTLICSGYLPQSALFLGSGFICMGIAILLFFGCNYTTKGIAILSKNVLLKIGNCFFRKGDAQ